MTQYIFYHLSQHNHMLDVVIACYEHGTMND
jgi:hypothetical protein